MLKLFNFSAASKIRDRRLSVGFTVETSFCAAASSTLAGSGFLSGISTRPAISFSIDFRGGDFS